VGLCASWAVRAALLAGVLLVTGGSAAVAAIPPGFDSSLPRASDAGTEPAPGTLPFNHHGPPEGHLPATQQELELVSRLEPTGAFGDVEPGQLADVAVHKGYAYLNSWDDQQCQRGGTYVIDIRNPAAPREAGFIPAQFPYYHGEGAHVVSINTPAFQGDVLAVNNETYGDNVGLDPACTLPPDLEDGGWGGFDLYDVTNPEQPVPLVLVAGDRDGDNDGTDDLPAPNAFHSVFVWQDGPRAFLVASDNIEETDVDIFDITNPRAPVQEGDFDLDVRFPQILNGENTRDETVLHHDVVVKHIDGRPVMKADYWDAGYVQLDVSVPSNPTLITDTTYAGQDPLMPAFNAEGNAHQGEFSFDNQFLLAADEDFGPYRLSEKIGGQEVDPQFGFGVPVDMTNTPIPGLQIEPGDPLAGDTRFIGLGCDPLTIPAPAGNTIAVIERGVCAFEVKAFNAEGAGYEGFVIFNSNAAVTGCETLLNMQFSNPTPVTIKGVFVARRIGFQILGVLDPTYTCTQGGATTPAPPIGTDGETLELAALFDGWGYAHLYDAKTSAHLDAFAIPEGLDERYATDFGVLSIHEFATDPTENLAYSAYYSGGIRVLQFDRANGLRQVGAYIAPEGNDFWGVEQFTTPQGQRLIAGSDRDFGLYLFRYTGPGAAQPPACSDLTVMVAYRESADVPLNCSDPNGNPLRQSRTSNPSGGTVTDRPPAGGWTYQHTGSTLGPAGSFTFRANDGAADSNVATADLVAVAKRGRCVNPFVGTNRRDTIIGSRFGDRISGRRAGDSLRGREGRDCIRGDAGRDRMSGHGHADRLLGNGGRDRVAGNAGRDRLFGNKGNDRLLGGGGRDRMRGGPGRNVYSGGAGADRVFARNGKRDRVRCGKGRDRVVADQNDRVAGDCEGVRRG
jgi:RTX calcium-binding nonapeptide repeat (4 copies)/PA domain/LVIVD repeat